MVREIRENELTELLTLYTHLHESGLPPENDRLRETWARILRDPHHHILVYESDGRLVSSCVCVVVPNLTRNVRPYALVENVVTHAGYRGRGYATACLEAAGAIARQADCYKIMLLTGSRDEATHRFYRQAGYNATDKTAYVQWL